VNYRDSKCPSSEVPVISPNFVKEEFIKDEKATIILWDSACGPDYDELRPRGYAQTHFFVLCFALNDLSTLANLNSKWLKEISPHIGEDTQLLLVGTKSDLRKLTDKDISPIRKLIKPRYYVELSAKSVEAVQELFRIIATLVVDPDQIPRLEAAEPVPDEAEPAAPTAEAKKQSARPPPSSTCILL